MRLSFLILSAPSRRASKKEARNVFWRIPMVASIQHPPTPLETRSVVFYGASNWTGAEKRWHICTHRRAVILRACLCSMLYQLAESKVLQHSKLAPTFLIRLLTACLDVHAVKISFLRRFVEERRVRACFFFFSCLTCSAWKTVFSCRYLHYTHCGNTGNKWTWTEPQTNIYLEVCSQLSRSSSSLTSKMK